MDIFVYILLFIMGIFFGSFCTLAIHRIPLKEDIMFKHSYCPKCNHKLATIDLFPVFSYIFLHGKCRYCGEKIHPRYFIIEILSGITFVLLGISIKLNIYDLSKEKIAYLFFIIIYITTLIIIAGIDKNKKEISKPVLFVGFFSAILYIIYLCSYKEIYVYGYVIYMFIIALLLVIDIINIKVNLQSSYIVQLLLLCLYIVIVGGQEVFLLTTVLTLINVFLELTMRKESRNKLFTPIGFYLCINNIIVLISVNFLCNYFV